VADRAVVENLTRTRARAMQDRVEASQNSKTTKRHWRVPELVLGLVLMVGGALGALLLARSGDSAVVVVGAARDLQRGSIVTSDDLVAIEIPSELAEPFIAGDSAVTLLGQTTLVDLQASTPLTSAMLTSIEPLQMGEALTSAAVKVGNYPQDLSVGDLVRVITVPDIALSQVAQPALFDRPITIWSIKANPDKDFALVTFRSTLDLSMAIANSGEVHISRIVDAAAQVIGSES